jgi:hypothetical protein
MWRGRVSCAVRHPLLSVAFGLVLSSLAGTTAAQVQSLTAEEAGNLIRFESGVRVVLIYSTTCKPSHERRNDGGRPSRLGDIHRAQRSLPES